MAVSYVIGSQSLSQSLVIGNETRKHTVERSVVIFVIKMTQLVHYHVVEISYVGIDEFEVEHYRFFIDYASSPAGFHLSYRKFVIVGENLLVIVYAIFKTFRKKLFRFIFIPVVDEFSLSLEVILVFDHKCGPSQRIPSLPR